MNAEQTRQSEASSADFDQKAPLRQLADSLFGFDFFISYCWADGRAYATKLAEALEARGYECFLDSDDYAKGEDWKLVGQRAIENTTRLVLVGSPKALQSAPVVREVKLYTSRGLRVIPIDFGGTLLPGSSSSPVLDYIAPEILRINEELERLPIGPAEHVIVDVARSLQKETQERKRTRIFAVVAAVFAVVAVIALIFGVLSEKNRRVAENNRRLATKQKETAQRTQSLFLSELAREQLQAGDSTTALLLSLEALPKDVDETDRPLVVEAVSTLATVLWSSYELFGIDVSDNVWDIDSHHDTVAVLHNGNEVHIYRADDARQPLVTSIELPQACSYLQVERSVVVASSEDRVLVYRIADQNVVLDKSFSSPQRCELSPSATELAIWDADRQSFEHEVKVVNLSSGRTETKILEAGMTPDGNPAAERLQSIHFSGDGSRAVVVFQFNGRSVLGPTVWDMKLGQKIYDPMFLTSSLDFGSRNSVLLETTSVLDKDSVRLVQLKNGNSYRPLQDKVGRHLKDWAISPDERLAVLHENGRLHVCSLDQPNGIKSYDCKSGDVLAMSFDARGDTLHVLFESGDLMSWRTQTGLPIHQTKLSAGKFVSLEGAWFAQDSPRLITLDSDRRIRIWSLDRDFWDERPEPVTCDLAETQIEQMCFDAKDERLAAFVQPDSLELVDLRTLRTSSFELPDAAFKQWANYSSRDQGAIFAGITTDQAAVMYRPLFGQPSRLNLQPTDSNQSAFSDWSAPVFSQDGTYVAVGLDDGRIGIWDTSKGQQKGQTIGRSGFTAPGRPPLRQDPIEFDPIRNRLICRTNFPVFEVWNWTTGERVELEGVKDSPGFDVDSMTCATFSQDGQLLFKGYERGAVDVVTAAGFREVTRYEAPFTQNRKLLSIHDCGHSLCGFFADGLVFWDRNARLVAFQTFADASQRHPMAISPDRDLIAVGFPQSQQIRLFSSVTGKRLTTFSTRSPPYALCFDGPATTLAIGGIDGSLTLCHVRPPTAELLRIGREGVPRYYRGRSSYERKLTGEELEVFFLQER